MAQTVVDRLTDVAFHLTQNTLVRLFLGLDYALRIVSGYSYRNGWQQKIQRKAIEHEQSDEENPAGRSVTIFGHPLLCEASLYLHNGTVYKSQLGDLPLRVKRVDADWVWMEEDGSRSALYSFLPEFISRRLRPERRIVLSLDSYAQYTNDKCAQKMKNLQSVLAVFSTRGSRPEALADCLSVLPGAASVDCVEGVRALKRLYDQGVHDEQTYVRLAVSHVRMCIGGQTRSASEVLTLLLPCCDNAKILAGLRGGGGGVWSVKTIFWSGSMEELRMDDSTGAADSPCLNEYNVEGGAGAAGAGGNSGFAVSLEELESKPATVLTALFSEFALPIEYVPRAIRRVQQKIGNGV